MNANTPQTERLADAFERITEMLESESSNTMITGPNNEQVPQDTLFSWFAIVLPMMKYVESSTAVDPAMKAIHFPWVLAQINTIENFKNQAPNQGVSWLRSNMAQIFAALWSIRTSLVWVTPTSKDSLGALAPSAQEILAQAESIQSTAQQSFHTKRNLERMAAVAQQDVQNLQEIVEKIKSLERTAASAQTTAGASAATAESQKDLVVEYAVELEESVESKRQLFDEFEKYREQIEGTLQGASKVALAKSFERRRDALIRAQKMWAIAFGIGILVLLGTGCAITHELVTSTPMVPSAVSSGSATVLSGVSAAAETTTALKGQLAGFVGVLLRFVVLSPVIWFTWFSARQ